MAPIPETAIRFIVGRMHVGTAEEEVEAEMRRRIAKHTAEKEVRAIVAYALKVHRENRSLYVDVMSGRVR